MEDIKSLTEKLSVTGLGKHVLFTGVIMKVTQGVEGCEGCVFDTEDKADGCGFRSACFAHLRKDRQSVIFTSGKQKRL